MKQNTPRLEALEQRLARDTKPLTKKDMFQALYHSPQCEHLYQPSTNKGN